MLPALFHLEWLVGETSAGRYLSGAHCSDGGEMKLFGIYQGSSIPNCGVGCAPFIELFER